MKDFINWIKGSMDNSPGGASSKKISAFYSLVFVATTCTISWLVWAFKHNDFSLAPTIIGLWLGFAASALGINAYEKVKGKEKGTNEKTEQ